MSSSSSAALSHCDAVVRLLIPPKKSSLVTLPPQALAAALEPVSSEFGHAVQHWSTFVRDLNGSLYERAVRVSTIVVGTALHCIRSATQVNACSASLGDDVDKRSIERVSSTIISHTMALLRTLRILRLGALDASTYQLAAAVSRAKETLDRTRSRTALSEREASVACAWPLLRMICDGRRALGNDTFLVPASVHDTREVLVAVGQVFREAPTPAPVAVQASPPHGRGFAPLLNTEAEDGHDFARCWLRARNAVSTATGVPNILPNGVPSRWSMMKTNREHPGRVSLTLEGAQENLFHVLANHLHVTVAKAELNKAFYSIAIVLCDTALCLDIFDVPLSQLPSVRAKATPMSPPSGGTRARRQQARQSQGTSPATTAPASPQGPVSEPAEGVAQSPLIEALAASPQLGDDKVHRQLPLVQPTTASVRYPNDALSALSVVHVLFGVGADVMRVAIDRIVDTAAQQYEGPPSQADPPVSGALLTVLSSVFQPLLAIFSRYPGGTVVPSVHELATDTLLHALRRVCWRWRALRHRAAPMLAATLHKRDGSANAAAPTASAVVTDLRLLRQFFERHPALVGAAGGGDTDAATMRRARLLADRCWPIRAG